MKTIIAKVFEDEQVVNILDCIQVDASDVPALKKSAKETKAKLEEETLKEQEELKTKALEAQKELDRLNHFSKFHLVYACDSLLINWQLGNEEIDDEKIYECKSRAINGEDVETLLNTYEQVKDYFVKVFGEVE